MLTPTTLFSQRAPPSPLWSGTSPKRRIRRGTTRISRVGCGKAKRGCASRVPPRPARRRAAREGRKWRERPRPFGRWCGAREGKGGQASGHPLPPLRGGRSLHSDPFGKDEMKTWSQVILVNLALTAVALRAYYAPGKVATSWGRGAGEERTCRTGLLGEKPLSAPSFLRCRKPEGSPHASIPRGILR